VRVSVPGAYTVDISCWRQTNMSPST